MKPKITLIGTLPQIEGLSPYCQELLKSLSKRVEVEFKEVSNGFSAIFRKDIYTEEYLRNLGLNERQIKAVMFVKKEGRITNRKYQDLFKVSKRTASDELKEIKEKNIFERIGTTGKGTYYILKEE